MKTIQVAYHRWHVVTGPAGGTVKSVDGSVTYCTIPEGGQGSFYAVTTEVVLSDESIGVDVLPVNFNCAPAPGGGGGVAIQFDTVPTSGSTNAVTSGGLYNVLFARELALGRATATGNSSIAVGYSAESTNMASTAIGSNAKAKHVGAMALGNACQAINWQSIAIGSFVSVRDNSAICIGTRAVNSANKEVGSTFFYIIPAGSTLSEIYENGEACLGYVVKDIDNNIVACGTRKLCDLLTNNTAFAPAALDLDAPAPTPFLPTGIMEPIESLNESNV